MTFDYFINNTKVESDSKDSIVSLKDGKYAIYDKSKSIYWTPHIYDKIFLSPYNYNIISNVKDLIIKKTIIHNIGDEIFSAIIDKSGNIKETPNLIFIWQYKIFFFL